MGDLERLSDKFQFSLFPEGGSRTLWAGYMCWTPSFETALIKPFPDRWISKLINSEN
jgi:hypothetical protein